MIFINHDDIRALELTEQLLEKGYYITDQTKDLSYSDILYFGLKGIDRKNRLMTNQGTKVLTDSEIRLIPKNSYVITLIHNDYMQEIADKYNFNYIALLNDEDYLYYNSILTAEGLISYIIAHRRYPLYESKVLLLGFGHCAKPILSLLTAFQAEVSVAVRNPKYVDEIKKNKGKYVDIENLDLSEYDLIINTIPTVVIDEKELDTAKRQCFLIDIASYPYGINHHYALSKGLNCIILPSIPAKYAYSFAAEMICKKIEEVKRK